MSRQFIARYPNAPSSFDEDAKAAWNRLTQILSEKDKQTGAQGLQYHITTVSPIATSVTLDTTSATYSLTTTTITLIKLINDLKKSGTLG